MGCVGSWDFLFVIRGGQETFAAGCARWIGGGDDCAGSLRVGVAFHGAFQRDASVWGKLAACVAYLRDRNCHRRAAAAFCLRKPQHPPQHSWHTPVHRADYPVLYRLENLRRTDDHLAPTFLRPDLAGDRTLRLGLATPASLT